MKNASQNVTYNLSEKNYNTNTHVNANSFFNNLIWITTKEASEFLRKSSHAVRQMVYKGHISARKFHGRLYFNKLELHELIDLSHY